MPATPTRTHVLVVTVPQPARPRRRLDDGARALLVGLPIGLLMWAAIAAVVVVLH